MGNPLQARAMTPPPPDTVQPQGGSQEPAGGDSAAQGMMDPPGAGMPPVGPQGGPQGGPQTGAGPLQIGQQPGPPQMPAPTHQQTVAALRHFGAIEHELTTLLEDPDLGKSDMKSKIIDGVSSLVAERFLTPVEAVVQLGTVPERPFDQKQWLEQHLSTAVQAQVAVLAHHGAAFAGQNVDTTPPDPDDHLEMMAGLKDHYQGLQGNKGAVPNA